MLALAFCVDTQHTQVGASQPPLPWSQCRRLEEFINIHLLKNLTVGKKQVENVLYAFSLPGKNAHDMQISS